MRRRRQERQGILCLARKLQFDGVVSDFHLVEKQLIGLHNDNGDLGWRGKMGNISVEIARKINTTTPPNLARAGTEPRASRPHHR
jgi:hypothetical protein